MSVFYLLKVGALLVGIYTGPETCARELAAYVAEHPQAQAVRCEKRVVD